MTPDEFIQKWKAANLKERSAAQEYFIDLCRLLDEKTPAEADSTGQSYCFERGATKTTGGKGWADVWKRGHFGWEYKGPGKDLGAAFAQLQQYAIALENPPLLVVCDLTRFRIHTNWTNTVSAVHEIALDDLRDPDTRRKLKAVLSDPDKLRPGQTRQALTEKAASDFARLAQRLRERGHAAEPVAHFINRLVFCMFAEDIGLLPNKMFARMLDHAKSRPDQFGAMAKALFSAMRAGGMVGFETVEWFNGGLFDDDEALPLDKADIELASSAAALDWSEVDPSIFGTLFERGLDPGKRSQLGAHYTDRDKIMLIVEPVIVRPLLAEWEVEKQAILEATGRAKAAKSASARTKAENAALSQYRAFLDRLRGFTVLDPACGSGNFLYLALRALKDLESRVMIEAELLGFQREFPAVGPASIRGIELNPYAAELARVTVWIGEIQWMRRHGFDVSRNPILKPLQTIECRDALLNPDGTEAEWPQVDVIVGNPPFIGGKMIRRSLGDDYIDTLFQAFAGRVPPEADFVTYWFEKARRQAAEGKLRRMGLVSTNSIRGGANRKLLQSLAAELPIYEAWSDEPWVVNGAAVRVSLVCAGRDQALLTLDGSPVAAINPDLTSAANLTTASRLRENVGVAFMGDTKGGSFDVSGETARKWLIAPLNPNGRPNSDVLKPWINGLDLSRRPRDMWIVDFGLKRTEAEASLYEAPFLHVSTSVKPERVLNRREIYAKYWWRHVEPRPAMLEKLSGLSRFIGTPRVSKHRIFVWCAPSTLPDSQVIVVGRDDDVTFGILHSRFHESWSLSLCTWLGVGNDPRYTPTTTFETFPFPEGLAPNCPVEGFAADARASRVAVASKRLDELRRNWLNPSDLVRAEAEVVPGFPDRVVPVSAEAAATLRQRTLTNLYNANPAWLVNAHADLDRAVAAAYGWPEDITDADALGRLLVLNRARAQSEQAPLPASSETADVREVA